MFFSQILTPFSQMNENLKDNSDYCVKNRQPQKSGQEDKLGDYCNSSKGRGQWLKTGKQW